MAPDAVWLVRHAQSASNAGERVPGPGLSPLTALGRRQADVFAAAIPAAPNVVVHSPFIRSIQTAAPILAAFPTAAALESPVQEFTYLAPEKYTNTTAAERAPDVAGYWKRADPDFLDGPGAESFTRMIERAWTALDALSNLSGFVVMVSHGQFMRGMLWAALDGVKKPTSADMTRFKHFREAIRIPNCGHVQLDFSKDRPMFSGVGLLPGLDWLETA